MKLSDRPDFTLPVSIEGVTIETLPIEVRAVTVEKVAVDIVAQSMGAIDVNITGSTTLNVSVVGTVSVNIAEAMVNISALRLMDVGTIKRVWGGVMNGNLTLYTVPAGKRAYIYSAMLNIERYDVDRLYGALTVFDGTNYYQLITLRGPIDHANEAIGFTVMSIPAGWQIVVMAYFNTMAVSCCIVVETSA